MQAESTLDSTRAQRLSQISQELEIHATQIGIKNAKLTSIAGAHNEQAFLQSIKVLDAIIIDRRVSTDFPGLVDYEYKLPKMANDPSKDPTGEYRKTQDKTTYDPNVISDRKMADMSARALEMGQDIFDRNPLIREKTIMVDNYQFRVTKDIVTNMANNAFAKTKKNN